MSKTDHPTGAVGFPRCVHHRWRYTGAKYGDNESSTYRSTLFWPYLTGSSFMIFTDVETRHLPAEPVRLLNSGGPAVVEPWLGRPVTLRRHLSVGLPFSESRGDYGRSDVGDW